MVSRFETCLRLIFRRQLGLDLLLLLTPKSPSFLRKMSRLDRFFSLEKLSIWNFLYLKRLLSLSCNSFLFPIYREGERDISVTILIERATTCSVFPSCAVWTGTNVRKHCRLSSKIQIKQTRSYQSPLQQTSTWLPPTLLYSHWSTVIRTSSGIFSRASWISSSTASRDIGFAGGSCCSRKRSKNTEKSSRKIKKKTWRPNMTSIWIKWMI